ncbi:MAG: hypothetical protein FWF46_01765 [Oscillospiraceae bacterium]|nr:hypothetical protein [Oscillospiraceae bacterium]
MKKTIRNIIIILYAIVAIIVTVCLLSFNEYKVTEFGNYSLVIIDSDKLQPNFNRGELVIVDRSKEIKVGDKVFFYNVPNKMAISLAGVTKQENVTDTQITYTLEGDNKISSDYVIGNSTDAKVIPVVGTVLSVLESKWGFLILVVLPALLAFLHEVFEMISEMRGNKRETNGSKQKK